MIATLKTTLAALITIVTIATVGVSTTEAARPSGVSRATAGAAADEAFTTMLAATGNAMFALHFTLTANDGSADVAAQGWDDAKRTLSAAVGNALFAFALAERTRNETALVESVAMAPNA